MAGKKTQAEIEFKVIDDGLKKEFNNIKGEGAKLRQELKLEQEQMKQNGSDTDKLGANLNSLKAQYETQTRAVQTLSQQLSNAQKYFGENSNEANKYEKQLRSAQIYQQQLSNRIKETSDALSAAKGDTSTYTGAMNSIEQAQKKLSAEQAASTAEFKKWQATAGQTATDAQKLAKAQDYVGEQSKLAAAQVDLLKQALARTEQEFGSTSTEAMQMKAKLADAETAMAELGNEAKNVDTTNLDDIGKKIDTGNLMEAADAIGELGEKVKDIGGEAINMSNEMSDASFKVANGAQNMNLSMEDAKKHIQDISETGIGSFEDVGEAVSIVTNQLGDLNESDLDSVTQSGMNLEKIYGSDMDETMRGANALMQTYGFTGKESMDLITAGTEQGLDKTHELGDNLAEYAPLMKQNGISAQDYFGMLKNGLESGAYNADKVNDVIKEMGIRINDGTARKGLESMGDDWVSMYDKAKKGGKSNAEIMELIQKKIGTLPNETKKAEAESTIWGTLAEDNGNKVMQSLFKTSGAFDKTAGSADKLNKKAQENNQWQASLQKMKDALLPIGDTIKDTLQPLLDMVAKIAKAFEGLPEPAKKFIVVIGLIVAAVLPVIVIVTKVIGAFTAFGALFAEGGALAAVGSFFSATLIPLLGTALSAIVPFLPIIAAVAAAIAAVILVVKNWGTIVDWVTEKWGPIGEFFSNLWNGIKESVAGVWDSFLTGIQPVVDAIKNLWNSLTEFFSVLWDGIVSLAAGIWGGITTIMSPIVEGIKNIWNAISPFFSSLWNGVVIIFSTVWNVISTVVQTSIQNIMTIIKTIMNIISTVWSTAWGVIVTVAKTIWDVVVTVVSTAINAVAGIIKAITQAIQGNWTGAWNSIKNVISTVWNGIKSVVSTVFNAVKSVITSVLNAIKTIWSSVWNGVKSITSNTWNGIKSIISTVANGIKNSVSSIFNGLKGAISNVWNGIKSVTSSVWNGIKNAMTSPVTAAKNVISGIIERIKGLFNVHLSFPEISIPHIPMPSFNVSGKFGINPPQMPHFSVHWNALGGIFNKPTLFGGSAGLQGVGEAGPEAVLPLNNNVLGTIGNAIAAATDNQRYQANTATYNITFNNEIASDYDTNAMFEKTDQWLADKGARNNYGVRGNA